MLVLIPAGACAFLAARDLVTGDVFASISLVIYVALLGAVGVLTRGNALVLVLVAYLLAPIPADNLLPQVLIFPDTDYALRSRDLFFLADLVTLAALIALRPELPKALLSRAWLAGLALLALYPTVIGVWLGAGQSVSAVAAGAVMPLRGLLVTLFVVAYVRRVGWDAALRDAVRTIVASATLLAFAVTLVTLAAWGKVQYSLGGYPLIVDGRPSLPGWGNNILANFFCVCAALLVLLRRRLGWSLPWIGATATVLVLGLLATQIRMATLLAIAILELPLILAVLRRVWPRRGPVRALASAGLAAVLLGLVTSTVLYMANPRYESLAPAPEAIMSHLPQIQPPKGIDSGGESVTSRGDMRVAATKVWLHNPVLGQGWNSWGWGKADENPRFVIAADPHTGFLWNLAETGALGLLLLYLVPAIAAWRNGHLWGLWLAVSCATVLELVNPNLRSGHFSVVFWVLVALGVLADTKSPRYQWRTWLRDSGNWLRGGEQPPAPIELDPTKKVLA